MIDQQGRITESFQIGDIERLDNITGGFLNETGFDIQDVQSAADYVNQTITEVFTPSYELPTIPSFANSTN